MEGPARILILHADSAEAKLKENERLLLAEAFCATRF